MCDFITCNKIMLLSLQDKEMSNIFMMYYAGNSSMTYPSWISYFEFDKKFIIVKAYCVPVKLCQCFLF